MGGGDPQEDVGRRGWVNSGCRSGHARLFGWRRRRKSISADEQGQAFLLSYVSNLFLCFPRACCNLRGLQAVAFFFALTLSRTMQTSGAGGASLGGKTTE